MRIVSLNAWGGACWPELAAWLPGCGADVLCLQEVIAPVAPGTPAWLRYVDPWRDLAQRGDLVADVSAALPGFRSWFSPAARGPLTDDRGATWITDHGLGLWTAPHLAVTGARSTFIHGSFRPDGWGEEPVPRVMQLARLHVPGMAPILVAQFHGLRDAAGKGDTPARQGQADRVFAALGAMRRPGDVVVLCGDFNLLPDSAFFARARAEGLTDLVTAGGHTDTRTAIYTKPVRFADYLLVSDPALVRGFALPATPLVSDHRPLILDLAPPG